MVRDGEARTNDGLVAQLLGAYPASTLPTRRKSFEPLPSVITLWPGLKHESLCIRRTRLEQVPQVTNEPRIEQIRSVAVRDCRLPPRQCGREDRTRDYFKVFRSWPGVLLRA